MCQVCCISDENYHIAVVRVKKSPPLSMFKKKLKNLLIGAFCHLAASAAPKRYGSFGLRLWLHNTTSHIEIFILVKNIFLK
jgi:hypothetical protein